MPKLYQDKDPRVNNQNNGPAAPQGAQPQAPQPQIQTLQENPQSRRQTVPMQPSMTPPASSRMDQDAYARGARLGAQSIANAAAGKAQDLGNGYFEKKKITPERLREADRILLDYQGKKSSVDQRIIRAQQWWKMKNWQQIQQEKGTKGATVHKSGTAWLWNCIVGKHADAIDSYPEPIVLPRMQDDKEEAKRLSDIVPVVMEMNGFEQVYSECAWQKMQEGTAAYSVMWDKTKMGGMGDIAIHKVNVLNLFWEPGINDIQDSKNVFYLTLVDNDVLISMYPQLKGKLNGQQFVVKKYQTDDSVEIDNKSAVIDWYYHSYNGPKKILHYCKYVGDQVLYSTEEMGDRGLYDDGQYPFVLDPLFPVEGSPCGYGYIDIGKDCQSDIDTLNQAMVLNAVASATPRYFYRKDGSVNIDNFLDWSNPLIAVNSNLGQDTLLPVQVNRLDGNTMNMYNAKIDELKFITGNTDVNNGGTPTGVTAASAIAALKEDSGRSSKDSTKSAYRAYAKIVTMVIERIRQFYDIPRYFRILGQNGQESYVPYSNEGIIPQVLPGAMNLEEVYRLPVFDIEVRAQRENAYTKMSQNELAIQFYNMGFFNPQATDQVLMCLDMMDFKGKEELKQKIVQNGTMADALAQVGQIALALAQKYQPEIADQLAMTLQGISTMGGTAPMMGGAKANPTLNAATQAQDATAKANDPNENSRVTAMKERVQNASRPQ